MNIAMCITFIIYLLLQLTYGASGPIVSTKVGSIQGIQADGEYFMFLGIPYAQVEEDNHFRPSKPYPVFNQTFEAFNDTIICPQRSPLDLFTESPHCLTLNIYVPKTANLTTKLPVYVWIYGGRFERGSAGRYMIGPEYLVQHDVIVVTVNYRTGPYGFMCLDIPQVPGNQGLKDQQAALRWVKENIDAFNGDANQITLGGQSAGSVSVDMHLLFDQEKLFNRVIMQSGSALGSWSITVPDGSIPLKMAENLGYKTDDIIQALTHLSTINSDLVIQAASDVGFYSRPCIERKMDDVEAFMTNYPTFTNIPNVKDMPVLLGYNYNELVYLYENKSPEVYDELTKDIFNKQLEMDFDYGNIEAVERIKMEKMVRHYYIGDEEIGEGTKWEIIDFCSDFQFKYPITTNMKRYINNGAGDIFFYVFSYIGNRNSGRVRYNITNGGASHADELGYLFEAGFLDEPTQQDQIMIERMTTMWTNFIKYGNPTPTSSDLFPTWKTVTKDQINYMNLDTELKMGKRPFHRNIGFWDLFYKTYRKLQKGYKMNNN